MTSSTATTSSTQDWIALDFINWRTSLDLSQEQAADILDYSSRTIINWERDDHSPIKRRIMLACRYVAEHPEVIPHLLRPRPVGLENEVACEQNPRKETGPRETCGDKDGHRPG